MTQIEQTGLLIILSSPSGAGKSTLARRLMDWDASLSFSISVTTRAPRVGEVDGKDYHFTQRKDFERLVANGCMLETALVFGNFYGSFRAPVEAAIRAGRDTLFDVDWQGGQQVRASALGQHVVSIFILPPSMHELERRLISRSRDVAEVIAMRMDKARDEISHWAEYDYVLVNDDLDDTEERLRAILTAERLRRTRQSGLGGFVQDLMSEGARRDMGA